MRPFCEYALCYSCWVQDIWFLLKRLHVLFVVFTDFSKQMLLAFVWITVADDDLHSVTVFWRSRLEYRLWSQIFSFSQWFLARTIMLGRVPSSRGQQASVQTWKLSRSPFLETGCCEAKTNRSCIANKRIFTGVTNVQLILEYVQYYYSPERIGTVAFYNRPRNYST